MYVLTITDDSVFQSNSTDSENHNIDIILSTLLLSIPGGVLFLFFLKFSIWKTIEPLLNLNHRYKFPYTTGLIRSNITGLSGCGNFFSNKFNLKEY